MADDKTTLPEGTDKIIEPSISNSGALLNTVLTDSANLIQPSGLAVSPDEQTLATINSGASKFSVTLIRNALGASPTATPVMLNATFMGVVFSSDGARFYASGGDNGNIWIGDVATGTAIGSVNLNGAGHPLDRPLSPTADPAKRFKGAFPGNMALTRDGKNLYVVDQGSFQVFAIDTTKIVTGVDAGGNVVEPDNFAAVVGKTKVGRYPFGISLSSDDRTLLVSNVGVFQYSHLRPAAPTGRAVTAPLKLGKKEMTLHLLEPMRRRLVNVPMNLAVVPSKDGVRVSVLSGFNLLR